MKIISRPTMHTLLMGLCLSILATSAFSATTYYRWVDQEGNTKHSDRPPPVGTPYEEMTMNSSKPVQRSSTDTPSTSEQNQGPRMAVGENPGKPMPVEKNAETCSAARTNIEALDNYARIRVTDADGELRYLTEDEKSAERTKAQASIKANCE
ncbi:MAG: DUF4124 domain-containing protein [Halioglobus sp.]